MTPRRLYSVFGLILESDFVFDMLDPVPCPEAHRGRPADLRATRATGIIRDTPAPEDPYFDITPETQYLHWSFVGAFRIDHPGEVLIEPHEGVSDHQVSQAFLGLVISLVLERKGLLCLHASAVSVANRAAIFLGDKGAGKSTTNGALLARGHTPLTDDLVATDYSGGEAQPPLVRPGFSAMKLWPDSLAALDLPEQDGDRLVHPSVTKMQKRMPAPLAHAPVPMGALFVLRRKQDVTAAHVERLPPHLALQMVLRFTFMARYGETRLGRDHLAAHMRRCGTIVAQVPVYFLWIPRDLARLNELARTIEEVIVDGA